MDKSDRHKIIKDSEGVLILKCLKKGGEYRYDKSKAICLCCGEVLKWYNKQWYKTKVW